MLQLSHMETLIKTIKKATKSRTNQVIFVGFLLNSSHLIEPFYSPEFMVALNSILTALGVYFRSNPKVKF